MDVLVALAEQAGEVLSRDELLEQVWGESFVGEEALTHAIWDLRRAFGDQPKTPQFIQTVHGKGYRLVAKVSWLEEGVGDQARYVLEEEIGRGAMGVVWRAQDPRLQRTVAVKFLSPELCRDRGAKARFVREARTAAHLDHPNICSVYEVDETDDGRMYLVMQLYEGETLRSRIDRGPIAWRKAVRIAVGVASGLQMAHEAGIVHRDVKPSNLMLGVDGTATVLDFGIAKLAGSQHLTATGELVGTTFYMSPEQARGGELDGRSDIWSLGVVLVEMLMGRRPVNSSKEQSVRGLFEENIDLARSIPESLAPVLCKMLARNVEERHRDCGELLRDLSPLLANSLSPPESAAGEALRPPVAGSLGWRSPRLVLSGLLGAVVIVTGLLLWFGRSDDDIGAPRPQVSESSTPVELTRAARARLTLHYDEREIRAAIEGFDKALGLDPEHAPAYAGLAEAYRRLNELNEDEVLLTHALASAERAVELNEYLAAAHVSLGLVLVLSGEPDRGEKELRKALELDPLSAPAHRELGVALWRLEDREGAQAAFARALELDPDDWWAWTQLGSLAFSQGRYLDAEEAFRRSTEVTPHNPWTFRNLAAAMQMQDRYEEAAAALQTSLEIQPAKATFSNLGTLLFSQGRFGDAVVAFERAVELGANSHIYWGNLGDAYRWAPGRRAEAPAAFERAIELARDDLNHDPGDSKVRSRLALYNAKAGDSASAIATLTEVLTVGALDASGWFRALLTYELAGDRERALEALIAALAAGYPLSEVEKEPELIELRRDRRYHEAASGRGGS